MRGIKIDEVSERGMREITTKQEFSCGYFLGASEHKNNVEMHVGP